MVKKRQGKPNTLLDSTDYDIIKVILDKKGITITELKNKIGLTHANLTTHLRRLDFLINRERDKQTIHLSMSEDGKFLFDMIRKHMPTLIKRHKAWKKELEKE